MSQVRYRNSISSLSLPFSGSLYIFSLRFFVNNSKLQPPSFSLTKLKTHIDDNQGLGAKGLSAAMKGCGFFSENVASNITPMKIKGI